MKLGHGDPVLVEERVDATQHVLEVIDVSEDVVRENSLCATSLAREPARNIRPEEVIPGLEPCGIRERSEVHGRFDSDKTGMSVPGMYFPILWQPRISSALAAKELGWTAMKPFEDGLREIVEEARAREASPAD